MNNVIRGTREIWEDLASQLALYIGDMHWEWQKRFILAKTEEEEDSLSCPPFIIACAIRKSFTFFGKEFVKEDLLAVSNILIDFAEDITKESENKEEENSCAEEDKSP
jgi:hypothetical protein